jgi:hypothetical protein
LPATLGNGPAGFAAIASIDNRLTAAASSTLRHRFVEKRFFIFYYLGRLMQQFGGTSIMRKHPPRRNEIAEER